MFVGKENILFKNIIIKASIYNFDKYYERWSGSRDVEWCELRLWRVRLKMMCIEKWEGHNQCRVPL